MTPDSWTSTATTLSSWHLYEAATGAAIVLLVLCAGAWRRGIRYEFGAAAVLVLAEGLHLGLFSPLLAGRLQPATFVSLAAATLAASMAALLWIAQTGLDTLHGARSRAAARANACGLALAAIALAANGGLLAWLAPLTSAWCALAALWLAVAGTLGVRLARRDDQVHTRAARPARSRLFSCALAISCALTVLGVLAAATQDLLQTPSSGPIAVAATLARLLLPAGALLLAAVRADATTLRPAAGPTPVAVSASTSAFAQGQAQEPRGSRMLAAAYAQVEGRLAALTDALEKQGQMHSLMSHEMRGPVSTISAAAQSLEIILAGSDEQVDSRLQRIGRAVTRITELMDQLLSQKLSHDDILAPEGQHVDLGHLASDVVEGLRPEVAHRLELEAAEGAAAWCDGPLTGVVLRNIIHNATKYSPADQPISIEVGSRDDDNGGCAWIAVTDRGPGIDKEDQVRIFDPHFRRKAHRETKGLGIGLHLVRKICERQGGTLTVQSEPGQGARFVISLPVRQPA